MSSNSKSVDFVDELMDATCRLTSFTLCWMVTKAIQRSPVLIFTVEWVVRSMTVVIFSFILTFGFICGICYCEVTYIIGCDIQAICHIYIHCLWVVLMLSIALP
jgi:hypothetical protein